MDVVAIPNRLQKQRADSHWGAWASGSWRGAKPALEAFLASEMLLNAALGPLVTGLADSGGSGAGAKFGLAMRGSGVGGDTAGVGGNVARRDASKRPNFAKIRRSGGGSVGAARAGGRPQQSGGGNHTAGGFCGLYLPVDFSAHMSKDGRMRMDGRFGVSIRRLVDRNVARGPRCDFGRRF